MKKLMALLVLATVVSSVTGCGCCRRLRDTLCRGAYCGTVAPAPVAVAPPVMAAPLAVSADCGCNAAPVAFDAGCAYPGAVPTVVGFGGAGCDTCSGGSYTLPTSGGVMYDDPGYLTGPAPLSTMDPGPAPTN